MSIAFEDGTTFDMKPMPKLEVITQFSKAQSEVLVTDPCTILLFYVCLMVRLHF